MNVTRQELTEHFRNISDEELLERASSGALTPLAQTIADIEVNQRGLKPPASQCDENGDSIDEKDWVPITSFMYLKEADIIEDVLRQEGIPAKQAAPNPQRYAPLAPQLDTAQVLVPRKLLKKSQAVLDAREASAEKEQ